LIDATTLHANLLFQGLTPAEIDQIIAPLPRCRLAAGESLFAEGDTGSTMYLVMSGIIEIFTIRAGEAVSIRTFMPGSYFGELALLGQEVRSASVRAIEDSVLLEVDNEALARITADYPFVVANIGRVLAEQLVTTTRTMVHVKHGELVMVVINGLRQRHAAASYLLDAATALTHGPMAKLGPHWLFPDAMHVAGAIRDQARPESGAAGESASAFAYRAGALLEARAGHDAVRLLVDYFRRWWQRTVIIISEEERRWFELAMPLVDRIFVVGTPDEIASWSLNLPPDAQPTIEAVPIVPETSQRREALRVLRGAGFQPPLIWLPDIEPPAGQFARLHLTDLSLPHQRGLLRLARAIAKTRIGLALGAGGARGMAHIGAIRYLEERGIPIDAFAGTSIGSLMGGAFACGTNSHVAETLMLDWIRSGPRKLIRPAFSFRSILSGKAIESICRDRFGSRHFIDLPTPLVAVAADLASGRSVSLKNGTVARAVQASMSIPGMFPPVMIGPYVLVDGGVADPVPSDTLPELGADILIVVNISYSPEDLERWAREEGTTPPVRAIQGGRPPGIFDAYQAAFGMAVSERAAFSETEANVYIRPRFLVSSWREFTQGPEHLRRGYEAAERAADQIAVALPWLDGA
jgi:NTE family protein